MSMSAFQDAVNYVTRIKREYEDSPHIYHKFIEILHMFESQEIFNPADLILRTATLFEGTNKTLILGLNPFLPDGYEIEIHGCGTIYYRVPRCKFLNPIYQICSSSAAAA
jgi:histone deacetylase complex regulatory component SIN3